MKGTIFILEQNEDVLSIMQYILEDSGYRVALTGSTVDALDTRSVKPDIILLDYRLARVDPKIVKTLKRQGATAEVPIILTTTENQPEKIIQELPADDILPMPFDMDELVQKVAYWLNISAQKFNRIKKAARKPGGLLYNQ